ncbi:MAG: hypothetical protein K6E59_04465 [Bacilli bacterium]|nr:hypothetical protein [Bacilli bacterium]
MGTFFGKYIIMLQRGNGEWRAFMEVSRSGSIYTCDPRDFDAIEKFLTREAAERCLREKIGPYLDDSDFTHYVIADKNDIRRFRRD